MTPPVWRDERGRRRPTRPCPRCGTEIPVLRLRVEDVRRVGWQPYMPAQYVEWCGHGQEVIPIPQRDGWCRLVPVLGEVEVSADMAAAGVIPGGAAPSCARPASLRLPLVPDLRSLEELR